MIRYQKVQEDLMYYYSLLQQYSDGKLVSSDADSPIKKMQNSLHPYIEGLKISDSETEKKKGY